jgi:flagellar hook assembly protein FlgD
VKILDAQGREVKQLVNNSTLGTTGFFRWDGDMNNGSLARTGYYIVWMEVFNANGKVDVFRKRVIVASRF